MFQCLATVVSNSPYQKLRPGLLTRTVKLVRPYLSHRGKNRELYFENLITDQDRLYDIDYRNMSVNITENCSVSITGLHIFCSNILMLADRNLGRHGITDVTWNKSLIFQEIHQPWVGLVGFSGI